MHDPAPAPAALNPSRSVATNGSLRRVGVEVEFMGLSARRAAGALADGLGGDVEAEDPHAFRIRGTRLGDMRVEMDLRYVHPHRHPDLGMGLGARSAAWLGTLVSPFVPRELITAPMPFARLPDMDEAVALLRSAGARGRGTAFLDSLSLHFNIDPPDLGAVTLTAFLKAFLSLDERLRAETARGRLRLALALPPDYPPSYRRRVLSPDYWPDLKTLTADYLAANPTRRRALDLLPLLAYLDEEQVRSALPREKIGPRPVFHYRLPQAHLSDPDWSIVPDWDRWLAVERLASERGGSRALGVPA